MERSITTNWYSPYSYIFENILIPVEKENVTKDESFYLPGNFLGNEENKLEENLKLENIEAFCDPIYMIAAKGSYKSLDDMYYAWAVKGNAVKELNDGRVLLEKCVVLYKMHMDKDYITTNIKRHILYGMIDVLSYKMDKKEIIEYVNNFSHGIREKINHFHNLRNSRNISYNEKYLYSGCYYYFKSRDECGYNETDKFISYGITLLTFATNEDIKDLISKSFT